MTWPRTLLSTGAVAVFYFAAARLALFLAIPPGYASAIWPAAGIALAATVLLGMRALPGIFLGSFLANIVTAVDSNGLPAAHATAVGAAIATGASLQALVAAALARRFVHGPNPLSEGRDIVPFLLLGGPVGSLVSSTCGVLSLTALGVIDRPNLLFSWWTWWVGDVLGAVVVAPICILWALARGQRDLRRLALVTAPLVIMFVLTAAFFVRARYWENERIRVAFAQRSNAMADGVSRSFDGYVEVLRAIAAVFEHAPELDGDGFRKLAHGYLERMPGIQALSMDRVVTHGDRADFERDHYMITETSPNGSLVRAVTRSEYVVVTYIEPAEGNLEARGFDVASEPERRVALQQAAKTRQPRSTGSVKLVQDKASEPALLVFVPVFREEGLIGYATGVFRVSRMLSEAFRGIAREGIDVRLVDLGTGAAGRVIYAEARPDSYVSGISAPGQQVANRPLLSLAGRPLSLQLELAPSYLASQQPWQAWVLLACGMVVTGLLGALLLLLTGRTERAEAALRLRDDFLSIAAHELRTPLTALKLQLGAFRHPSYIRHAGELPALLQRAIARIEQQHLRLEKLVGRLLDVTRITGGRLELELEDVDLAVLVSECVREVEPDLRRAGCEVSLRTQASPRGRWDPFRLRQVLENLLVNAAKYGPGRPIEIEVSESDRWAQLCVRDHGIGIDPKDQTRIFLRFERAVSTRHYAGLGLGLWISRSAVEAMGGTLSLEESAVGAGCLFVVRLPKQTRG